MTTHWIVPAMATAVGIAASSDVKSQHGRSGPAASGWGIFKSSHFIGNPTQRTRQKLQFQVAGLVTARKIFAPMLNVGDTVYRFEPQMSISIKFAPQLVQPPQRPE